MDIHSSTKYNSSKVKTTQMSINEWKNKMQPVRAMEFYSA